MNYVIKILREEVFYLMRKVFLFSAKWVFGGNFSFKVTNSFILLVSNIYFASLMCNGIKLMKNLFNLESFEEVLYISKHIFYF